MLKERRKHIVTAVTLLVPANNSGAFSLAGKLFASICRDRCESHDVGANLCDKRKICLRLGTHEREREREEVKRNSCRRCGRKCHMIGIKSARAIWRAARRSAEDTLVAKSHVSSAFSAPPQANSQINQREPGGKNTSSES